MGKTKKGGKGGVRMLVCVICSTQSKSEQIGARKNKS